MRNILFLVISGHQIKIECDWLLNLPTVEKPPTILFRHQLGPIAQSNDGRLIVYPGTIVHMECLWIRRFGTPKWEVSHQYRQIHHLSITLIIHQPRLWYGTRCRDQTPQRTQRQQSQHFRMIIKKQFHYQHRKLALALGYSRDGRAIIKAKRASRALQFSRVLRTLFTQSMVRECRREEKAVETRGSAIRHRLSLAIVCSFFKNSGCRKGSSSRESVVTLHRLMTDGRTDIKSIVSRVVFQQVRRRS